MRPLASSVKFGFAVVAVGANCPQIAVMIVAAFVKFFNVIGFKAITQQLLTPTTFPLLVGSDCDAITLC